MEFVWIEPGTFRMGTTDEQELLLQDKELWDNWFDSEQPAHQVTISQGFYLGKFEITKGQWEAVTGTAPWAEKTPVPTDPNDPAVFISWEDAQAFIRELNTAAGEEIYRLPSEAEWEYACRAGTNTLWSFGDDETQANEYIWYGVSEDTGLQYAQSVGSKKPNPWGLYDMHGNVWEWCYDKFDLYSDDARIDPTGPTTGSLHVKRGGYDKFKTRRTRSANRDAHPADFRSLTIGARLVRVQ